jgi:hypothetical protein
VWSYADKAFRRDTVILMQSVLTQSDNIADPFFNEFFGDERLQVESLTNSSLIAKLPTHKLFEGKVFRSYQVDTRLCSRAKGWGCRLIRVTGNVNGGPPAAGEFYINYCFEPTSNNDSTRLPHIHHILKKFFVFNFNIWSAYSWDLQSLQRVRLTPIVQVNDDPDR